MGSPKSGHRRRDLAERLSHLRPQDLDQETLIDLLQELRVQQEEMSAQSTQLMETQRALEETRDRYADLYDFAPIGYMTISTRGIINEINLTGAAILRRERSRIIGFPFGGFLMAADALRFAEYLHGFQQLEQSTATVELELSGGSPSTHLRLVTRRHTNDSDAAGSLLTALIDISERKRLVQERGNAEDARDTLVRDREIARAREDAKDHFLAMLSHELRTPLTPIMATMSNERLVSLAPEPLLGALHTVRRNLDLEVRLIDDLLDVTRMSRDRLVLAKARVDIHQILGDVVEMVDHEIRQSGVRVSTRLDAPKHWVIGDSTRLRQVFWNLLGNALKFTGARGTVTIQSSAGTGDRIRVSVSDTGIGMDDRVVRSINRTGAVEQTPSTSSTGLGLGLAICRGVINAHNGTLHAVSSGRGGGSTFIVELPIAAHLEQWDGAPTAVPSKSAKPRVKRILLVEDHADSADTLSLLLMHHDFEVSVARNLKEAISIANREAFDLLISDIRLPDGSGLELIRRLQSRGPIRGIAISGFGTEQDKQRSREAGYETHLIKPVDFDRLLDAIEKVAPPAL